MEKYEQTILNISILVADGGLGTVGIDFLMNIKLRRLYEFSPGGDEVDGLPPGPSFSF